MSHPKQASHADTAAGHVDDIVAAAEQAAEEFRRKAEAVVNESAEETRQAAELEASRIRDAAATGAARYLEDSKRALDEFTAERMAKIGNLTDELLQGAEAVQGGESDAETVRQHIYELIPMRGYHSRGREGGLNGSGPNGSGNGQNMEQYLGSTQPEGDGGGIRLEHITGTLRRRWWVILLLAVVGAGLAYGISKAQQKQYTATSSVLFQTPPLSQQAYGVNANPDTPSDDPTLMATDLQLLLNQGGLTSGAARLVGHGVTSAQVAQAISVSEEGQTTIADVSATTASPSLSAAIVNAYTKLFVKTAHTQSGGQAVQALNGVEREIKALGPGQLNTTNGQNLLEDAASLRLLSKLENAAVVLVSLASPPASPSSPRTSLNTGMGLAIGLLLGLSLAFLLERFDRRIKNVEQLEEAYKLPLLAAVPQSKMFSLSPDAAAGRVQHGEREVFRLLHTYLRYFNIDRELRCLMIASAAPGDGKSTVARNLAQAAQETGTNTLLIEADLRLPDMARHYGIDASPGLSELLVEETSRGEAIQSVPLAARLNGSAPNSLDVLAAGTPPPNPAELLESRAMADLLSWASENYELVVVDTPPLSVVSDAIPLVRRVDGVLVVSQLGKNTRDAATFLRERLAGMNAPLLGVVANAIKGKTQAGYGYGYGYGYGHYGPPAEPVTTSAE